MAVERVDIERSGGFAGVTLRTSVGADALPADVLDLLQQKPPRTRPRGADRFEYKVVLHDPDRTLERTFREHQLPSEARAALDQLLRQPPT